MSLPTSFFVGQFSSSGDGNTYVTTFPMGHPDTGVANYSGGTGWFSPGYAGLDIGTNFQLSQGTDISQKRSQNRASTSNTHSYWLIVYEHTNGTLFTNNQEFTVRGGWRIDSVGNSSGTTYNSPKLNTLIQLNSTPSPFIVPSNKRYYLGWYSGAGGGYANGGGMFVQSTGNTPSTYDPSTTTTTIAYKGSGVSLPSVGDTIIMDQVNQAINMQLGLKA